MIQGIDPQVPPDDANFVLFPKYNDDKKWKTENRAPKAYPKDPPPESLLLPSRSAQHSAGRYLEAKAYGAALGPLIAKREKPVLPGWLIELDNTMLSACMDIKDAISMGSDLEAMTEKIYDIICKGLGVEGVTASTVLDVLRRIPSSGIGLSFPHFMFAMGNMSLAQKRNLLLNTPRPYDGNKFQDADKTNKKGSKKKGGGNKRDSSGYSPSEQVFFSGLLIFEMYDTIAHVEDLYYKDKIPESKAAEIKRNIAHGFGPSNIGFKKHGMAAWDMPLPPLPKRSPYLDPVAFVTTRWKIVKPSVNDRGRRRTLALIRPVHMLIEPPDVKVVRGNIRVMENKKRIQQAMVYLASQGDVVAMLPNSHFLINISDTFIEKMEEYKELMPNKDRTKIYHNNDECWITRHAKDLYRPHGVPPQITHMPHLIRFIDAINLRIICQHIRLQHWHFICEKHKIFREECWKRMHVDRIPAGRLRDSFVYSFITYLPLEPHLPIINNVSSLPY